MSLRTISECSHVFTNAATATIPVLAAIPGKRVCIYRMVISAAAAASVTLQDTSGAALSQAFQWTASNIPLILETQDNGDMWFSTNAGLGIQLAQSGTVNIGIDIWFQLLP